jgi:hypothetical protein
MKQLSVQSKSVSQALPSATFAAQVWVESQTLVLSQSARRHDCPRPTNGSQIAPRQLELDSQGTASERVLHALPGDSSATHVRDDQSHASPSAWAQ